MHRPRICHRNPTNACGVVHGEGMPNNNALWPHQVPFVCSATYALSLRLGLACQGPGCSLQFLDYIPRSQWPLWLTCSLHKPVKEVGGSNLLMDRSASTANKFHSASDPGGLPAVQAKLVTAAPWPPWPKLNLGHREPNWAQSWGSGEAKRGSTDLRTRHHL